MRDTLNSGDADKEVEPPAALSSLSEIRHMFSKLKNILYDDVPDAVYILHKVSKALSERKKKSEPAHS